MAKYDSPLNADPFKYEYRVKESEITEELEKRIKESEFYNGNERYSLYHHPKGNIILVKK